MCSYVDDEQPQRSQPYFAQVHCGISTTPKPHTQKPLKRFGSDVKRYMGAPKSAAPCSVSVALCIQQSESEREPKTSSSQQNDYGGGSAGGRSEGRLSNTDEGAACDAPS